MSTGDYIELQDRDDSKRTGSISQRSVVISSPNENNYVLSFETSDVIIFRLVNTITAVKIIHFIYHPILITCLIISSFIFCVWFIIAAYINTKSWIQFEIYRIIWSLFFMLWAMCSTLSINIKIFKITVNTFTFWFKAFAGLQYVVSGLVLEQYYGVFYFNASQESLVLSFHIFLYLGHLIMILLMCSLDSIYIPRKMKICYGICVAMAYTIFGIITVIEPWSTTDITVVHITSKLSFSVYQRYSNALGILAIFFWQQTVYMIFNPYKCVTIRTAPYVIK